MNAQDGRTPARPARRRPGAQADQPARQRGQAYGQWRARCIAYGRWEPWAPAAPVREHVRELHRGGASLRAIGRAGAVSPMTVHRLLHDEGLRRLAAHRRMRAAEARRLLRVTQEAAERAGARRNAAGTRLRLRALTALGYPASSLAAGTGAAPGTVRALIAGRRSSVSQVLHGRVAALYDERWDRPPPESTGAQRRAAAAARARAAQQGWPPPMGLDDDKIDDPGYRPRANWRPAAAASSPPRRATCPAPAACRPGAGLRGRPHRGRER